MPTHGWTAPLLTLPNVCHVVVYINKATSPEIHTPRGGHAELVLSLHLHILCLYPQCCVCTCAHNPNPCFMVANVCQLPRAFASCLRSPVPGLTSKPYRQHICRDRRAHTANTGGDDVVCQTLACRLVALAWCDRRVSTFSLTLPATATRELLHQTCVCLAWLWQPAPLSGSPLLPAGHRPGHARYA